MKGKRFGNTILAAVLACALALPAPGLAFAAEAADGEGAKASALQAAAVDLQPADNAPAAAAVWTGAADTAWYGASATSFEISTPEQLAGLAAIVNGTAAGIAQDDFAGKTVVLTADIALNAEAATSRNATGMREWTPIGQRAYKGDSATTGNPEFHDPTPFNGTFDGAGHVVENIFISGNADGFGGYQGLFGALGGKAVVKDVGIEGGFVAGRVAGGIASISYVGPDDGSIGIPHILNCYNTATIEGDGSTQRGSGGIFGGEFGSESDGEFGACYIANCYNAGIVRAKNSSAVPPLGGIAGTGSVQLFSCYNVGSVAAPSSAKLRGGLVGAAFMPGSAANANAEVVDSYSHTTTADGRVYTAIDATHSVDAGGRAVTDGALTLEAMRSLADDGLLSLAFVSASGRAPMLYWETGAAPVRITSSNTSIAAIPNQSYTGSPVTPGLSVTYTGGGRAVALKAGSDYLTTYSNNVEVGAARATVQGIGGLTGTLSASFTIGTTSLENATIESIAPQWMYGDTLPQPDLTVKVGGTTLRKGTDYQATYAKKDATTAAVTITPAESSGYTGQKSAEFTLVAAPAELEGEGTAERPYRIATKGDLQLFSTMAYKVYAVSYGEAGATWHVKLAGDIDAAATADSPLPVEPIVGFAGTFDGGGHTVNLVLDRDELARLYGTNYGTLALFPAMVEGDATLTIKDLKLTGSVTSTATAGALLGDVRGSVRIEGVTSDVDVTGYRAYGFADTVWPRSEVKSVEFVNCENSGDIIGSNAAAGFVREWMSNSSAACAFSFSNCVNSGNVTSSGGRAAGLLATADIQDYGRASMQMSECANTGAVHGASAAGGLVAAFGSAGASNDGKTFDNMVSASCNTGAVTSDDSAAGALVGIVYYAPIALSSVYNTGAVATGAAEGYAGGLVGATTGGAWSLSVQSAYNAGEVTGAGAEGAVGAFVGAALPGGPYGTRNLVLSDAYYLSGGAGGIEPIGKVVAATMGTQTSPVVADGSQPKDEAAMKKAGAGGLADLLGSAFLDDFASEPVNGGFPLLYWQGGQYAIQLTAENTAITGVTKTAADTTVAYTGKAVVPEGIVVKYDDGSGAEAVTLQEGRDYKLVGAGNVEVGDGATLSVVGVGRYAGAFDGYRFTIGKRDLSTCTVADIAPMWANETYPAKPEVRVTTPAGGYASKYDDYTVAYAGNTATGTATVTVTAKPTSEGFTGSTSAAFSVTAASEALSGSGTGADPYKVASREDLAAAALMVNNADANGAAFALAADFDISGSPDVDPLGMGWNSAAGVSAPFSGTLDGAGHTITRVSSTPSAWSLLGYADGATVRDLTLAGSAVARNIEPLTGSTIGSGMFMAEVSDVTVTFSNCVNATDVEGRSGWTGGFVGSVRDFGDVTFTGCVNTGTITDTSDTEYVGGFVGCVDLSGDYNATLTFQDCLNKGAVSKAGGSSQGGIVGGVNAYTGSIAKISMSCVGNMADVSGMNGNGGLAGVLANANLTCRDVFNTGAITSAGAVDEAGTYAVAGGLVAASSGGGLSLVNAYNAGRVAFAGGVADDAEGVFGSVIGGCMTSSDAAAVNVHYAAGTADAAVASHGGTGTPIVQVVASHEAAEMREAGFAEVLGDSFGPDVAGVNKGFPIFDTMRVSLAGGSVSVVGGPFAYSGQPIEPAVVVRDADGSRLVAQRDYLVFYRDNIDAGTAVVTVSGIGSYRGQLAAEFGIAPALIADCTVAPIPDQVETGSRAEPALSIVNASGTALVEGRDYTVSYTNNASAGTAYALVEGKGNYEGYKLVKFAIVVDRGPLRAAIAEASHAADGVKTDADGKDTWPDETWATAEDKAALARAVAAAQTVADDEAATGAQLAAALASLNAARNAFAAATQPGVGMISVYVKQGSGEAKLAKAYTRTTFEALKSTGAPVSALYRHVGGNWRVSTAVAYVTLDDLLADAGVSGWASAPDDASITYTADNDPGKGSVYTRAQLRELYFYPLTGPAVTDNIVARETPFVFAITENSSAIGENGTESALEAEAFNVAHATNATEPRAVMGVSEAEYIAGTAMGSRLVFNLRSITVTLPEASDGPSPGPTPDPTPTKATTSDMLRLYNPNSGEHFYTANAAECRNLVGVGWTYEGVAWKAPSTSKTPVYRLYNPNAGDHHYTTSVDERDFLVRVGWNYEGIGWYSDDAKGVPLYRLYNPNAVAGAHHYTAAPAERDHLDSIGWNYEGIGWYGVK